MSISSVIPASYSSSSDSISSSSNSSTLSFFQQRDHKHNRTDSTESFASSLSRGGEDTSSKSRKLNVMTSKPSSLEFSTPTTLDGKKRKGSPNQSNSSAHHNNQKYHSSSGARSESSSTSPITNANANDARDGGSKSHLGHKKSPSSVSKRIKTARACDSCRRKKIRCDVIDDGSPVTGNINNGNGGLTCAHCKQYGFECTFFLPITETRFKKKREREAEEMAAAAAAAASAAAASHGRMGQGGLPNSLQSGSHLHPSAVSFMGASPTGASSMAQSGSSYGPATPTSHLDAQTSRISATQEWPRLRPRPGSDSSTPSQWGSKDQEIVKNNDLVLSPKSAAPPSLVQVGPIKTDSKSPPPPPPPDTRVLGPTSIAYIVHSTAFVPGAAIEQHDLKHHQTFEVGASGDGIIKFHKPPKGHASLTEGDEECGEDYDVARIPESVRGRLAGDVAEKLVNTYFEKIGYLFPVMTKSEFLHLSPPPPLLLYAICGVAALSRDVPKEVLTAVKSTLNSLFRDMDLLSNSNNNTVKALLIMSLHSDLHGNTAVQGGTRCWNRVGAAIRMAQDLGLHRDASGRDDLDDDAFFLEQKRRIWGCCVTADRCMSVSLGHPLGIDLTDCDVRLPSPHEILRYPSDLPSDPSTDRPFGFNTEMLKLSILFGRVMKTVYSPTGLMKTTDEDMIGLLNDIDRWKENLPIALQFKGPTESSASAGILHVSFACLMHLLFRVFMRISYNCPKHLSFSLTIERMTKLIKYTRESIEWVDLHDFYLDTLQFVSYGIVFCATVQYHAWIRRGDHLALAALKRARECVTRFKRQGEHDASEELSMRAKTAEVITMLHDSAMGAYAHGPNTGNLNPTAGVTNRRTADTVRGIVFKQDRTRPGGGVYVAQNPHLVLDDLPRGTIILQETESGRVPALIRTDQEINGGWRPIESMGGTGIAGVNNNNNNSSNTIDSHSNNNNNSNQDPSNPNGSPTAPDLTYVAGDVWTDAQGRPVNRRGSRLLTMIPVQANEQGQQYLSNAMPRLSFSDIIGVNPNKNNGNTSSSEHQQQQQQQSGSSSTALNDAAWLNAMSNSMNPASFPSMNAFNDAGYTIDGQQLIIPAHAFLLSGGQDGFGGSSSGGGGFPLGSSAPSTSGTNIMMGSNAVGGASMMVDPLSLDEMPGGPLDFAAWESWFRGSNSVNTEAGMNPNH